MPAHSVRNYPLVSLFFTDRPAKHGRRRNRAGASHLSATRLHADGRPFGRNADTRATNAAHRRRWAVARSAGPSARSAEQYHRRVARPRGGGGTLVPGPDVRRTRAVAEGSGGLV